MLGFIRKILNNRTAIRQFNDRLSRARWSSGNDYFVHVTSLNHEHIVLGRQLNFELDWVVSGWLTSPKLSLFGVFSQPYIIQPGYKVILGCDGDGWSYSLINENGYLRTATNQSTRKHGQF